VAKDKTKKPPGKPAAKKPVAKAPAKPQKATEPKPVPPPADEPKDIYALVADCARLYHEAEDAKKLEVASLYPVVSAVVAGYAAGLSIPTTKALQPLRDFRYFFLPRPKPVNPAESVLAAVTGAPAPKPWEPVPPSIARLIEGTSPDAEHGTWQTGGIVWEFRRGWTEPRPTGEHVVSEYASSAAQSAVVHQERQQEPDNPEFGPPLDFAEPTENEKTEVLAETGPAVLGTEPVSLPLNPTAEAPVFDQEPVDDVDDYEPTREELEEEERQREREEAEAAREHEAEMTAGKRRK